LRFIHGDLGQRSRGDVVEFQLEGNQTNIALIEASHFQAFRNGRSWRGLVRRALASPVRLSVPHSGHWHAVIYIPEGRVGHVSGGIRVIHPKAA
jgi:Domain of unknown function (DUF1883).